MVCQSSINNDKIEYSILEKVYSCPSLLNRHRLFLFDKKLHQLHTLDTIIGLFFFAKHYFCNYPIKSAL